MDVKRCSICKKEKPLTAQFWRRDKHNTTGFRSECKMCQKRPPAIRAESDSESVIRRRESLKHLLYHPDGRPFKYWEYELDDRIANAKTWGELHRD